MASWYLAPSLVTLRQQINAAHPGRDKSTDGAIGDAAHNARKSDHNADWDSAPPGIVRAIDVDRDLRGSPTDPGVAQALVDRLTTDPRVAYIIYRRRIWQNPAVYGRGGWQPYTPSGKSGWFNPHDAHFHVSIRHGASFERDTSHWPITDPATPTYRPITVSQMEALALLGYYQGRLDGAPGPMSHAAIAAFQAARGLHPDGQIGPLTTPILAREATIMLEQIREIVRQEIHAFNVRGVGRPGDPAAVGGRVELVQEIADTKTGIQAVRTTVTRIDARQAEHEERLARIEATLTNGTL